jgi:hypothetical protein
LLRDAFDQRSVLLARTGGGQQVDDLLTLRFKLKTDVNDCDLEILATTQSKGSTCSGGSGTDNESCRHNVTRLSIVIRITVSSIRPDV